MYQVIVKAGCFIMMILLGMFAVRIHLFTKEDGKILNRLVMNFTLPCALISGFGNPTFSSWMVITFFIGFAVNFLDIFLAKVLISRRSTPRETAVNLLCCANYNIGCFAVPFCQSFFPSSSLAYLIMFDIGNSIMSLGGTAMICQSCLQSSHSFHVSEILKRFTKSVPLMTYVLLILLSLLHVTLPDPVSTLIGMIGQANIFLIFFMIGTQMDLSVIHKKDMKNILKIVAVRILAGILVAAALYFLPIDANLRNVILIGMFAPVANASLLFAQELDLDTNLNAMAISLTIPLSLVIYTAFMILMV